MSRVNSLSVKGYKSIRELRNFEQKVRTSFETPEHINDSIETKPSRRLENILDPKYKKTTHGPLIAESIGLNNIEAECAHFKSWVDRLRELAK